MPSITLNAALMKARFSSFNITLESVVPPPGSGPRIGAGLPMPAGGMQMAGGVQPMASANLANRPNLGGVGAAPRPAPPTGTPMQCPPALFKAATNQKIDCDFQKAMHDELSKFFDAVAKGLEMAFSMWKIQAYLTGVKINGPVATGGKIIGPALDTLIQAHTAASFGGNMTGWSTALATGVARGFHDKWREFCDQAKVPALPWYPAFAAFPGPMAPPMPNVPTPFFTLISPNLGKLLAPVLKEAMKGRTPNGTLYAEQVCTAVAEQLNAALLVWFPSQMVAGVMGKGPIPTFAPPYVPVGPVVMGDILPNPGHFAT